MRLTLPKANKYGNHVITDNEGNRHDSEAEYARWVELKWLQRAGEIRHLRRQVRYELIPTQKDDHGKVIERAVDYIADFVYEKDERTIVEDVKGVRTKEYVIKRKLMLYKYGIRIREMKTRGR